MNAAPCGFHPTFIGSVPEKCCRISPDLYYTTNVKGELAVPRSGRRSLRPTANFSSPRDILHRLPSGIEALDTVYHTGGRENWRCREAGGRRSDRQPISPGPGTSYTAYHQTYRPWAQYTINIPVEIKGWLSKKLPLKGKLARCAYQRAPKLMR